jgi:hypothetical protein
MNQAIFSDWFEALHFTVFPWIENVQRRSAPDRMNQFDKGISIDGSLPDKLFDSSRSCVSECHGATPGKWYFSSGLKQSLPGT